MKEKNGAEFVKEQLTEEMAVILFYHSSERQHGADTHYAVLAALINGRKAYTLIGTDVQTDVGIDGILGTGLVFQRTARHAVVIIRACF